MSKKFISALTILLLMFVNTSCTSKLTYQKYEDEYYDIFDTYSNIIYYVKSEEEYKKYSSYTKERLTELNKLFDIYNNYENINNIKTINDNAGIKPVEVNPVIIDLLTSSKQYYYETGGAVNISMGSVLKIWHLYRDKGIETPENAEIPSLDILKSASNHTDIENIIINEEQNTVFIKDSEMSIDVGALAKGYAAEITANELKSLGLESGLINMGGNVRAIEQPMNSKKGYWSVGLQDPDASSQLIYTLKIKDKSVVTSGNYQRYYIVDGKKYHHIIDNKTLMPADTYKSVTIIHDNSSTADMLSTALFIMPYDDGLKLAEKYSADVIWIFSNDDIKTTDNINSYISS